MTRIVASDTPIPTDVGQRIDTIILGRDSVVSGQNLIRIVDGADQIEITGTFTNPSAGVFAGLATEISVSIGGQAAVVFSDFSVQAQDVYNAILSSSSVLYDLLGPLKFVGGAGSDFFYGGTFGNDTLSGNGGDDELDGERGDDTIDGGSGADFMNGGDGSDVYFVDDGDDYVRETNDVAGIDEVRSSISLDLADRDIFGGGFEGDLVENLTLLGGRNLDGAGNTLKNVIVGNGGDNEIDGRFGRDELYGGKGSDRLLGGQGGDILDGGGGSDELFGGKGGDLLVGGGGGDRFAYQALGDSDATAFGRDTIEDFSRKGGDIIDLSRLDAKAGRSGNQGFEFVGADEFSGDRGELRSVSVQGENFVYADVNGDKIADFSIIVTGVAKLVEGDFFL